MEYLGFKNCRLLLHVTCGHWLRRRPSLGRRRSPLGCCCCSHINSHNQVRGHSTGSSTSGAEEYPKKNHNPRLYTHISQLKQFMPPPDTYKSEVRSQSTMCQAHTGAYVSLLASGETNINACHPRKTTTYILHVVSITTHTHGRRKSIGEKKQREENMIQVKERKEKSRKRNKQNEK